MPFQTLDKIVQEILTFPTIELSRWQAVWTPSCATSTCLSALDGETLLILEEMMVMMMIRILMKNLTIEGFDDC